MPKLPKITSLLFQCNILRWSEWWSWFFLHVGKHESLIQIDTMILMGMAKDYPQNSKIASLQCLYNISKRKLRDEVVFLYVDKHRSFLLVDFNALFIKVSCKMIRSFLTGMIEHSQSTQSSKFVISLQCLKVRN